MVSGVATSALGGREGGFGRCVFTGCFLPSSGARDSMVVVRSFGFPDTDDTILSFCFQSQVPFTLVEGRSSSFPNEPCVGATSLSGVISWYLLLFLQATMDVSLSSFVGYSETRAGQPVHEEAHLLVHLRGFSGCD